MAMTEEYYLFCINRKRFCREYARENGTISVRQQPGGRRRAEPVRVRFEFCLPCSGYSDINLQNRLIRCLDGSPDGEADGSQQPVPSGWEEERKRLMAEIDSYKTQIDGMSARAEELERRNRCLEDENRRLSAWSGDVLLENTNLAEELEDTEQQVRELRAETERMAETNAGLAAELDRVRSENRTASEQIRGLTNDLNMFEAFDIGTVQRMYLRCISGMYHRIMSTDDIGRIRWMADNLMDDMKETAEALGIELSMHRPGEVYGGSGGRTVYVPTGDIGLDGRVRRCGQIGCSIGAFPRYSFDEEVQVWRYDPILAAKAEGTDPAPQDA